MAEEEDELTEKQIAIAMAAINKQYKRGTIFLLGSDDIEEWPSISTGAPTLDKAIGIGGLPLGRIVEIFGPESSGKTTLALSVIAEAQKANNYCAFIDTEHALDPAYAKKLGVDHDKLLISQPDYGEQALDVLLQLVSTGNIKVVVLDSVAALVPKAELEGNMEAQQMGLQARLMSKAMRKLVSMASETGTLVIFVNQLREKIGVMFGNPEVTPGGRALKYNASVRIDIRRMKDIKSKEGNGPSGVHTKTKIVKNKMAPPFKIAEFDILYGEGVDKVGCIVDMAIEAGYLVKAGAWIKYGEGIDNHEPGAVMAQGREDAILSLKEDKELLALFKMKVNEK